MMAQFKIRNVETKQDFAIAGYVQRWSYRPMAEEYRDELIAKTGQLHRVYAWHFPAVGDPRSCPAYKAT